MKRSMKSIQAAQEKIAQVFEQRSKNNLRKIFARGNSDITSLGYRDGNLIYFTEHHPLLRRGEITTWFLVQGTWTAWGWFNAWDETQYLPTKYFNVSLPGGGQGRTYLVPATISPDQQAIEAILAK